MELKVLLHQCEFQLLHTSRDNNKVADFFANLGCNEHKSLEFLHFDSLPRSLKSLVRIDKSGIVNVRCSGF
ncbi:hypothetical protein LguiB_008291 [Lonicera macranthoides]